MEKQKTVEAAKAIALRIATRSTLDTTGHQIEDELKACKTKAQVLQVVLTHMPPISRSQYEEIQGGT